MTDSDKLLAFLNFKEPFSYLTIGKETYAISNTDYSVSKFNGNAKFVTKIDNNSQMSNLEYAKKYIEFQQEI